MQGRSTQLRWFVLPFGMDSPFSFSEQDVITALWILAKMGIGAILGAAIGFEREMHGRPAGIRTHMLVITGVILFSEVSRSFGGIEKARIAAQIVTGMGFLGAGTIMRNGTEIKGLTSAASMWAVAAIGMSVSIGGAFMLVAIAATVLTLFTLGVVDHLEGRLIPSRRRRTLVCELSGRDVLSPLVDSLEECGIEVERTISRREAGKLIAELTIRGGAGDALDVASHTEGVVSSKLA